MKKIKLFITLIFITNFAISQETKMKFGLITQKEIDLVSYDKDKEAEAVILFDIGKSLFIDTDEGGYDIEFTRTKRIKILDRSGIEFATVSIPFYVDGYGRTEYIKSIEAFTYNIEHGRLIKTKLDLKTIFEETTDKRWKAKKFVFPNVKVGSIIEYKFVLVSPFHFNLPDWTFQDRIPTIYSQYTVNMIPFYEYVYLAQGIKKFDYQNTTVDKRKRIYGRIVESIGRNVGNGIEFNDNINTYVMKDVAAFKGESYITSIRDYIMKMDFQLSKFYHPKGGMQDIITTWPKLNEELLKDKNFGKYIKNSSKIAKNIISSEFNFAKKDNTEKSKEIIEYVRMSFSWNGIYSKYASKSPKKFIEQKDGNSADINLFLIALLNAADIKAQAVIISTRNHRKIYTKHPFAHFLNYVIVYVKNEKSFLTDGTENLVAHDKLPLRCINNKGLLVEDNEEAKWISLHNNTSSTDNKTIHIDINPENLIANTTISIQTTDYESFNYKHSFENDSIKLTNHMLNSGFTKISNIKTYNFDQHNKPYIITIEGESSIEKIGDKIIVSPLLGFPIKEHNLNQKKRTYPVDYIYSITKEFNSTINIPEGYKIITIPENYTIDNKQVSIKLNYTQSDDSIKLNAMYKLKKAVYKTSEYSNLKYFMRMIINKFNEQIVFEKI